MEQALIEFYYQFHINQHYFLCHDILEEAWKAQPRYSKEDDVVSLILFSTACYHYRRGNTVGAKRSAQKALSIINLFDKEVHLGLKLEEYRSEIQQLIFNIERKQPFEPVHLPLTEDMVCLIIKHYPDFTFNVEPAVDSYIINHHLERDRTEVHRARHYALMERQQNRQNNK
ncbi:MULTISPECIES: DUF309 domain-containing protein [Staphylococcus]|uniref:DUF309 domain-containing protein n=1 Tax=Staphylococcus hsinchuensis TaxID=3051183 RepID=A0ABZ3EC58_9STAP|nr:MULTISPECIES: DUF309 domain-containing protein [unclassified Staphylococcus]